MSTTIAILSGGESRRLKTITPDKGLLLLNNKPMILWMIEIVQELSNNILVIVSTESQKEKYLEVIKNLAEIVIDKRGSIRSSLLGAHAAFMHATGKYTILLPNDTPLLNRDALLLLIELSEDYDVILPRWPNGFIEPLHAIYRTETARKKSQELIQKNQYKLDGLLQNVKVLYINAEILRQFDPQLNMFFNVNTPSDLKKLKALLKKTQRR
ncbi:MAG: molybdenum cofactor guanylyltransferase [Promethearchaeota archaeon]